MIDHQRATLFNQLIQVLNGFFSIACMLDHTQAYHYIKAFVCKGHIINIGSTAGKEVYEKGNTYCASKFAVNALSQGMRIDLLRHKIKVTAVHPGAVMTDSWSGFDNSSKRIMEAEDIAKLVFSASQLSVQACVEDIIIRPQQGDL